MSKKNISKISLWILIFSILSLVTVAMVWSPRKELKIRGNADNLLERYDTSDIIEYSGCYINQSGQICINGVDPHIVFKKENIKNVTTIVIKLKDKVSGDLDVQLYFDDGNEFNENDSCIKTIFSGDDNVGFELTNKSLKQIRIDVDSDFNFDDIEIYSGKSIISIDKENMHYERIIYSICFTVFIISILLFIDKKLNFSDTIICFIGRKYKIALRDLLIFIVSLVIGAIIAYFFSGLKFMYSTWLFCSAIVAIILFVLISYRTIKDKPEKLLVRLVFVSSITMLFVSPIGHISWDIDSHFKFAISSSSVAHIGLSEPEVEVLTNGVDFIQNTDTYAQNIEKINTLNKNSDAIIKYIDHNISLTALPSGVVIALLRLFGANFFVIYKFGQIPIVLVYSLCCYFAMKRLHSGKMILAVVAMFPTSLFIASNYSYDTWVIGFVMIGMAYFVGNCQEEGVVSTKDTVIMVIAFAIAIIPKQIYLAFLIIPFLMKRNKIENKKKYYSICSMAFVIMLFDLLLKTIFETSKGGDVRGGAGVNPTEQILYIIHNPVEYTRTLLNFLKDYLSIRNMNGFIDHFAYLGIGTTTVAIIVFAFLVFTTLTDKREYDVKAYSKIVYIYDILMFFGTVVLIATSLYIAYTEVGSNTIAGCQSRYITPLIYPLFAVLGGSGIRLKFDYRVYNYIVMIIMQSVSMWCIYQYILIKML